MIELVISKRTKVIASITSLALLVLVMVVWINQRKLQTTADRGLQKVTAVGLATKEDGGPIAGFVTLAGGEEKEAARISDDGYFTFVVTPGRKLLQVTGWNGTIWCREEFEFGPVDLSDKGSIYVDLTGLKKCGEPGEGSIGPEKDDTPPKIIPGVTSEEDSSYKVSFTVEDHAWGNKHGQILLYYRHGTGNWQLVLVDQLDDTHFEALIPKSDQTTYYFVQAGGAGGVLFSQYPEKGPEEPAKIIVTPPSEPVAPKQATCPQGSLAQGLLGCWTFDDLSSDGTPGKVTDGSGNNNHGSSTKGVIGNSFSKRNKSAQFRLKTEQITVPDSESMRVRDYSFGIWVASSLSSVDYPGPSFQQRLALINDPSCTILCRDLLRLTLTHLRNRSSEYAIGVSIIEGGVGGLTPSGDWHHLVVIHNGLADIIYIDGKKADQQKPNGSYKSLVGQLTLGGSDYSFFLDEALLWNRALTTEEVKELYENYQ